MGVVCLGHFKPEKLFVEYMVGVTATEPIIPRRYTLTHSDLTGELFLTIGNHYAWNKINPMRDEVLGEWKLNGTCFHYFVYLHIDQGQYNQTSAAKRNEVFRRELPLALTAIKYGDKILFNTFPHLAQAPIIVNFISAFPEFARQENWGTFQSIIT